MLNNHSVQRLHTEVCRALILVCPLIFGSTVAAAAMQPASTDLLDLSLEELSNIQITSVSKHAGRLSDAPASVFVITADDIRRSGANSLPEVLRLAPNLQVAQVTAGAYAISARGFNNALGNKLLVLIDGRTIYTPLYSGVNWDAQNVMLEDVKRIEVISGPGAALWGANAVNGVINVITHGAQDTQGGLVVAGSGNRGSDVSVRYGGKLGEDGNYRVYGMRSNRENTELASGMRVADGLEISQGGFRADWGSSKDGFTFQGDVYNGTTDKGARGIPTMAGTNLLARWNRELADGSSFQLQSYYDHTERDDPSTFRDEIDTFDIEFQHALTLAQKHKVVWGGGYRYAYDRTQSHFSATDFPGIGLAFVPAHRTLEWSNIFVQDEVALGSDVTLTLGAKAETNVYTNLEFLPSIRLAWKPDNEQLVWSALSRAVRAPSRIDSDFRFYFTIPPGVPVITVIDGGAKFKSEVANVLEVGYRAQPSSTVSYSITGFYSQYDKLRSGQTFVLGGPAATVQNMMEGTISGVEAWGSYQAAQAWRLSAGFTTTRENFKLKPGSTDPDGATDAANDPANTWMLRSSWNMTNRHDIDMTLRHVSALPSPTVPQYTAVDARFAWRLQPNTELSLTLQNLFEPKHIEFGADGTASEIERSAYFKIRWSM